MAKVGWLIVLVNFSVLTLAGSKSDDIAIAHVYADVDANVSLPCMPQSLNDVESFPVDTNSLLIWIREGKALQHSRVDPNGVLFLTRVSKADSGLYTCQAEESYDYSDSTYTKMIAQVQLHVKSNVFIIFFIVQF